MDLKKIASKSSASNGAKCDLLLQAKNEKTGEIEYHKAFVIVAGADSQQFISAKHAEAQKRIEKQSENPTEKPTIADIELSAKRVLAACIIDWGDIIIDGKKPDDNLSVLVEYPQIAEQIDAFIGRRANFIPSAQKS